MTQAVVARAMTVQLSDVDAQALISLSNLVDRHAIVCVRAWEGNWVMEGRVPGTGNYKCPKQANPFNALRMLVAGREVKLEEESGKVALVELLRTGLVTRGDIEWAAHRFDENGTFRP